jgi:hypothetical protein
MHYPILVKVCLNPKTHFPFMPKPFKTKVMTIINYV